MALYNKYRPKEFNQVIGQGHITSILKTQVKARAFHHSYLFCGCSGTGKTTMARLLASCLNCYNLNGVGEPCGECQSCKAIQAGRSWDTIELDGARFRGIDDIKSLVYKASFSPIGNKKVYIIDECHQLTEPAWNSLLKLLEEPPDHLVTILCTTEFTKIPETVSSRCELFIFKKLKAEDIKIKIERIAETEGIELDPKHAEFIAQSSGGNMRKGENLLEQCLVIKKQNEWNKW